MGRDDMLRATLSSITQLDFEQGEFEVIVVTKDADESLENVFSAIDLRVIKVEHNCNISQQRNLGVEHSTGKYLAFLDADVSLSSNWLEVMLDELVQVSGRVLVSAHQAYEPNAQSLEIIRTTLSNSCLDCSVRFLPGRNLFLERKHFLAVGGFPEHLETCEDYYFTDKIHGLGELFYTSKTSYIHLGEDKQLGSMFKKEIWRGQSNLKSIRGRNIPLEEVPSFLVPIWILLFFLLTLLCAIFAMPTLSFFSLFLCLLPIVLYSLRLHRIAKGKVKLIDITTFYSFYFPARIIGTIGGLFSTFKVHS